MPHRSARVAAAMQAAGRASYHGVLSRQEALAVGLTDDDVQGLLRRGRWQRLYRGVCAIDEPSDLSQAYAAILAVRPISGVASHATAARAHGLPLLRLDRDAAERECVTVGRHCRGPFVAGLQVYSHNLGAADQIRIGAVHVTGIARTVMDLLLREDRATAIWAAERALATGRVSAAEITDRLEAARHVPGTVAARKAFALADCRSESPLETLARLVIIDGGLPLPEAQIPIVDPSSGELWFRVDLGYKHRRIAIECDGREVHGRPDAVFADRRRQNQLHLLGWTVLRITWYDVVHRPAYVLWLIKSALAEAS
ncbi:MAG: hypothetical protein ACR2F6_01710 [Mycobacteriales bacterium]